MRYGPCLSRGLTARSGVMQMSAGRPSKVIAKAPRPDAPEPVRRRRLAGGSAPIDGISDRFFRHLIFNLRNGVLAITRDGRVAAMNDIAYRVLGLSPRADDIGRPFGEVLLDCPEVARVLQS